MQNLLQELVVPLEEVAGPVHTLPSIGWHAGLVACQARVNAMPIGDKLKISIQPALDRMRPLWAREFCTATQA